MTAAPDRPTANLRHPHILPLYDSGKSAGVLVLTRTSGFVHAVLSADFAQAAADARPYLVDTGADSANAADLGRRIRDPGRRREAVLEIGLYAGILCVILGLRLRIDPGVQAALVRLGYPAPQDFPP